MRVLIIDDEMNICISLQNILQDEGYECKFLVESKKAITEINNFEPKIILLDVRLDSMNGLDLLKLIKERYAEIIVIMISGHSGISEAVKAIKLGAFDFLEKPLSLAKVKLTIKHALNIQALSADYHRLKTDLQTRKKIVGNSKSIMDLKSIISKVAPTNSKVLIRGESGTGKELVAYAIYAQSLRNERPFIKFNSAAIPNELIESELFGFERGAFTGAVKRKNGKIEQADGGTIFLDEIGDMNLKAQAKILRVIQDGEFERVGSNKTQKIDTRIIAATNKNLEEMVKNGEFRSDLFYRLNVIPIYTSPLRDHPEDIPVLIEHFRRNFAIELNIPEKEFTNEAISEIQSWKFKGNVRELRNLLERMYILIPNSVIKKDDVLSFQMESQEIDFWNETGNFKDKKKDFETKYLTTQLLIFNGNLTKTAESLGLQISNLSRKIKELKIDLNKH